MADLDELKNTAGEYLSEDDLGTLEDAYAFALARHKVLLHSSGGSYISHLLDVANTVAPCDWIWIRSLQACSTVS